MSISSAITAARSGLLVSGQRADIVATNVANATTPGYVRRSVVVGENMVGTATQGVESRGTFRASDSGRTAERMLLSSDASQASVKAATWQTLSSRVGDQADGTGLFGMMSNLESALKAAQAAPESPANLSVILEASRTLVNEFQSLSQLAATQRAEADREIADGVNVVNSALKEIESLNSQISALNDNSPKSAALKDERQRQLDVIAEYLPVESVDRNHGTIDVVTKEGVYLLAGKASQIEFSPSNIFTPNNTVEGGQLSRLTVGGNDLTPGASSWAATSSGLFGALFTLRDTDLPEFSRQLDTVAGDLISRLSADGIDPTTVSGEFGLFVDPDPAAGAGVASRIAINPAIDPAEGGAIWRMRDGVNTVSEGPPGNSEILSAMVDALTSTRSINAGSIQGSFTASQLTAQFASLTGQARVSHEAMLSAATTQHQLSVEAEQSLTGVDVDSEMQDLLLIEQAYAANARVIEVASQMIDRLMEL